MSSLRPELHVAQQIRRDKLRIHNGSSQHQHLHEFPNNLEQLSLHPGFDLDLLQVRNNVRNGNMLDDQATLYSSEMIALERHQELGAAAEQPIHGQYGSVPHSSSIIHSSRKQQCGNRRNSSSTHQSCDWMVNNNNNVPTDVHSSSPSFYQKALQDIFKSASISGHGSEMSSLMHQTGHGLWGGINASEPVLNHPSYGNQANLWTDRTVVDNALRWNSFTDKKINEQDTGHVLSDSNPQGLSLSLSSNSHSNPSASQFDDPQSRTGTSKDPPQYSKDVKSLQDPNMGMPSNTTTYRNVGPLGPFTGYATILKSSRFLKPCQQLLDEYCSQSPELGASTSADAVNVDENGVATKRGNSGVSSSTMLYNSNENSADGGASNSFSSRPECQKNKAKLLYMEEEVTRRCKQYQQQMQMVVSSFETVAGLSSATPYISLALKSVSRHFRCLKNAISDQLKLVCEVLGEDLSIPTTSTTSSSKLDTNMARLRCMNQSFQKNKSSGGNMDFLEPQQHVWRPQRGLPERAVTILKAWLFEHFLHPYPTDTDKHMLATQTGLSRNQVSNWFINARVRVWKPMVEEIHMLETKGTTTGANQNSSKNEGTCCASEGSSSQPRFDEPLSNFEEKDLDEEQWNQEKRSKYECEITSSMDGTLMGFMPYRRGGGLGPVSLTLGLRHGVEGVQLQQQQQQQLQLQQEQQQLRRHFGGHMCHDFVG